MSQVNDLTLFCYKKTTNPQSKRFLLENIIKIAEDKFFLGGFSSHYTFFTNINGNRWV